MTTETLPRPMSTTSGPRESRFALSRIWRGTAEDARWIRPCLLGLLLATALLYLWGLGSSGWANSFYSAAAQAGSTSWKAWFFGSSDAANSITVDKPPASLWVMGLSVRIFGLSSWSILVPQALMGVASVGLLYGTVRRAVNSAAAGLIAGLVLATTPIAVLMFRFNNPDALLVLLMVGAAAATLRAVQATWIAPQSHTAMRWLALAGVLVGFAFLTKMLQAFLILPGLGLAYLLTAGPGYRWPRRIRDLAVATGALVVSAGWWVATVALWPASDRPYIGGSQHNSILELTLGYNGFGRLSGNETGSVGGGGAGGGGGGWGATGWLRMLSSDVGGQVGWLLPTALLLLVAGLWLALRQRLAGAVAALVLWGGWLLVTAATFSFMQGIFHAYYTVALAPAIGAIVGIGTVLLWRRRGSYPAALTLAAAAALTTLVSIILLDRSSDFAPWLRWAIAIGGFSAAVGLGAVRHLRQRVALAVAVVAVVTALAGPAAYSLDTAKTPHTGSIPTAGPAVAGSFGFGGHGGFFVGGAGGRPPGGFLHGTGFPGGSTGARRGGTGFPIPGGRTGTFPGGTGSPFGGAGFPGTGRSTGAGTGFPGGMTGGGGAGGGLLDGSTPSTALVKALEQDAVGYTWIAATIGSNNASGYQLATQLPVMAIGGFNGSDPSPTLTQFKAYVAAGRIHYFIATGGGGLAPGGGTSSAISAWVMSHFTATTVGGATLYDLSGGAK